MSQKKTKQTLTKTELHPRNRHRERYDFNQLIASCKELAPFVSTNIYGNETIDFFNPIAVKTLNKALLKHYYNIEHWDIPANYLCPPIPGRADYIHHIADYLYTFLGKERSVKCLDIGMGANCVYPIIGNKEYGWTFVGSDIDPVSIQSANKIIASNPHLAGKIEIRQQRNPSDIFQGIIKQDEHFDLVICNPPFHKSFEESQAGALRKLTNLSKRKISRPTLNFGGKSNELWCSGGEAQFIRTMITQSKQFANSCFLFSTLVSKQENLNRIYAELQQIEAIDIKTIPMGQGNKVSRIVAWHF